MHGTKNNRKIREGDWVRPKYLISTPLGVVADPRQIYEVLSTVYCCGRLSIDIGTLFFGKNNRSHCPTCNSGVVYDGIFFPSEAFAILEPTYTNEKINIEILDPVEEVLDI